MPQTQLIIDSTQPVNELIDTVKSYFGKLPLAWGRYFTTGYPTEYSKHLENNILNVNDIRLLPIARHTNHVGGSYSDGSTDAKQGVDDLFETFTIDYLSSQGKEFFLFLDVEGNKSGPNGSLSEEYYTGWSETLMSYSKQKSEKMVAILPCLYANFHDDATFSILVKASSECYGLWIARYHNFPIKWPSWDNNFAVPKIIQESSLPVYIRQYASDKQIGHNFDLDQTNPNITNLSDEFLSKLILPPKL